MRNIKRLTMGILIIGSFQLAACRPTPVSSQKVEPAHLESVEGSDLKRIVLTEMAAERIGLQTEELTEEPMVRTRRVGGEVIALTDSNPGEILVRVSLYEGDLSKVDRSESTLITSLTDNEAPALTAQPVRPSAVDTSSANPANGNTMANLIFGAGVGK